MCTLASNISVIQIDRRHTNLHHVRTRKNTLCSIGGPLTTADKRTL